MRIPGFSRILLFSLAIVIFSQPGFTQTAKWERELSKDGKIEVMYHVGDWTNKTGEEVQLIEYIATTTTDLSLENCIKTMRDVSLHKQFMGDTEESKELETYSENEWLAYYFFEPPWPMTDNDCVMKVNLNISDDNKTYVFVGESVPELIEKKDVKRLEFYEYSYTLEEQDDNMVIFNISVKLTPVGSAPNWMVKKWFPKGPIEFMEKFINLASELK